MGECLVNRALLWCVRSKGTVTLVCFSSSKHTLAWPIQLSQYILMFYADGDLISRVPTEDLVPDPAPQETRLAPKGPREDPSPGLDLPTITKLQALNLMPENGQGLVVQETGLAVNVSPGHKSHRCCYAQDYIAICSAMYFLQFISFSQNISVVSSPVFYPNICHFSSTLA